MAEARTFTIRGFAEGDGPHFAALNRRWIEQHFGIEEEDIRQLERPQETILARGGHIAIAERDGEVVATGAVLPASHPPPGALQWMEIVKMATAPQAQGLGIGGAVLDHLLDFARSAGADAIWLETNDRLKAATALYSRKGFERLNAEEQWQTPYARCNLQMALIL